MSRVGKAPISLPNGVVLTVVDGVATVKGPKGELQHAILAKVRVSQEDATVTVAREDDSKVARAQHGLMRSLLQNMATGVSEGFKKQLELNGVGYKVSLSGNKLKLALGYSHDVEYESPKGIELAVDGNVITVQGIDKQQVGQVAAEIRALRKPEPYKGKGIKYVDEQILRKSGKAAGGGD